MNAPGCRAACCFVLLALSIACGGGSQPGVDSAADEGPVIVGDDAPDDMVDFRAHVERLLAE